MLFRARTSPHPSPTAAGATTAAPGRRGRRALRRTLLPVLAAAALASPLALAPAASAATGQITGYGGKCVDVAGGSSADGTRVQLWPCNGQAPQQWDVG
ncbi:RICIN domain-containing protein, partial [Pseudokineococcus basanitobsidens]